MTPVGVVGSGASQFPPDLARIRVLPLRGTPPAAPLVPQPDPRGALSLLLGAVAGAVVLAVVLLRRRTRRRSMAARILLDGLVEPELAALGAPALAAAARVAHHREDWLRALRYGFASLLVELQAWGVLRPIRASTNRELAQGMNSKPEVVAAFEKLAACFDTHWYGRQPVGEADWIRWSAGAAALREALGISANRLAADELRSRATSLLCRLVPAPKGAP